MHPLHPLTHCPKCGSTAFDTDTGRSRRCNKCGFTLYSNAAAAVAVIIRDSENRILLTTRAFDPAKGMLDLPGGFVDHNETAEDALHREVKEELDIEIHNVRYLCSRPNIYPFGGLDVHTLDLIFTADIAPNDVINVADDVADAQFYPLSAVIINKIGLQSIKNVLTQLLTRQLAASTNTNRYE